VTTEEINQLQGSKRGKGPKGQNKKPLKQRDNQDNPGLFREDLALQILSQIGLVVVVKKGGKDRHRNNCT
jgi:hypothetical protein